MKSKVKKKSKTKHTTFLSQKKSSSPKEIKVGVDLLALAASLLDWNVGFKKSADDLGYVILGTRAEVDRITRLIEVEETMKAALGKEMKFASKNRKK